MFLQVADLARERAAQFGAGEWGAVAGLLHDLGKYSDAFQARLEGRSGRVDHSTAGALEAGKRWQGLARPRITRRVSGPRGIRRSARCR